MNDCTFTSAFNECNPVEIANILKNKHGYYVVEEAISQDTLSGILSSINLNEYLVNNNHVGIVRTQGANFHSHTLAVFKECYDMVTHEKIRAICRNFFDGPFKLSNQRIYETHTKAHMPWHTDNNLQSGNTFMGKHNLPGILFLFYLSDVSDTNPFQFIPHSHEWSANHNERYFSDKLIEQNYADKVVSVRALKGTLVMCNTHLIHRAKPFNRPGFKRLTYLFQVDALSDDYSGHGEELLINPSFVDNASPEVLSYLGFGLKSTYPTFPQTSVSAMSHSDLWVLQKNIIPMAVRGLMQSMIKNLLPSSVLIKLKNMNLLKSAPGHFATKGPAERLRSKSK